ncbi:MAG: DEAD/DEAH box helicase [Thermomicrobiales bacterium]
MTRAPRRGLRTLAQARKVRLERVTARDIAWSLAPTLKVGRRRMPEALRELLSLDGSPASAEIVGTLREEQRRRAEEADRLLPEIEEACRQSLREGQLAVAATTMGAGIATRLAMRMVERFHRPVVLLNRVGPALISGTLRGPGGFDAATALDRCAELCLSSGGHPGAAAFRALPERIPEIVARLRAAAADLSPDQLTPRQSIDAILAPGELTPELLPLLARLEPMGTGNPRPTFALLGVEAEEIRRREWGNALTFRLRGTTIECKAWNASATVEERLREGPVDLAVAVNEFPPGRLQLELVDVRGLGEPEPVEELPMTEWADLFDDQLLTWIELREAHRISYGFYDHRLRLDLIIREFRPSAELARQLGPEGLAAAVTEAIERLSEHGTGFPPRVICWGDPAQPERCAVRTRSAEFVRLLYKLRQRFGHKSLSDSLQLTDDLRYEVRPRHVPRRNLPPAEVVRDVVRGATSGLADASLRQAQDALIAHLEARDYRFSVFQREAFECIAEQAIGRREAGGEAGVIVGAGTGAGKTDAFFLPALLRLLRDHFADQRGTKVICIYPRVKLAEDHFSNTYARALALLHEEQRITLSLGIDYGNIPYRRSQFGAASQQAQRWMGGWVREGERWRCKFVTCPCSTPTGDRCGQPLFVAASADRHRPAPLHCDVHGAIPYVRTTRDDLCQNPPDILLTTTESLNEHLGNAEFARLWGLEGSPFAPPSVVMVDEAHLHSGTKGVQIAYLLRRLKARLRRGDSGGSRRITFVGLSATLADPGDFFARLTGVPESAVSVVLPRPVDLRTFGAEHLIFLRAQSADRAQVLSTLIQTAMALLHVQLRPGPRLPERAFGFMDSLDVLHRWDLQMRDAEQERQLWRLRLPAGAEGSQMIDDYAGPKGDRCAGCHDRAAPHWDCPLFRQGECWWVMAADGLREPSGIAISSSQVSETLQPQDQLVITTSANEVGVDDPQLMAVLQYTAPRDVAGFVQRRGRMGRRQGDRPTMVTVLSPFRSADNFYFQNHDRLLDPRFRPLPLNVANRVARRIHAFYALTDRLAALAAEAPTNTAPNFSVGGLDEPGLRWLMDKSRSADDWRSTIAYLMGALDATQEEVIAHLSNAHDGVATRQLGQLLERGFARLASGDEQVRYGVAANRLLPEYLPGRLFSELNLPELTLALRGTTSSETLAIEFGLREAMPGRVSYRHGLPYWVPLTRQPDLHDPPRVVIDAHYDVLDKPERRVPRRDIPQRIRDRIPTNLLQDVEVYRPRVATLTPFGSGAPRGGEVPAGWFLGRDGAITPTRQQGARELFHRTTGNPLGFTLIEFDEATAAPRFTAQSGELRAVPALFDRVAFGIADEEVEPDTRQAHRAIRALSVNLGADVRLQVREPDRSLSSQSGPVLFGREDGRLAALGYHLETEGIQFIAAMDSIHQHVRRLLNDDEALWAHLWWNAFRLASIEALVHTHLADDFTAERFVSLYVSALGVAGFRAAAPQTFNADGFHQLAGPGGTLRDRLAAAAARFRPLAPALLDPLLELADRREVRDALVACFGDYALGRNPGRFDDYLDDLFVHSLEHALKQTCESVGGVETLSRLASWVDLRMDVGSATGRITVYELGTGGIGIMHAVQREFRDRPQLFWRVFERQATECEVHAAEQFGRALLRLPDDELAELARRIREATFNFDGADADQLIRELTDAFRERHGFVLTEAHFRFLTRLFAEPIALKAGGEISSWQLYKEINVIRWEALAHELGREPTLTEARYAIARQVESEVDAAGDGGGDPTPLQRLYRTILRDHGATARRAVPARQAENSGYAGPDDDADDDDTATGAVGTLGRQIAQRLLASCGDVCIQCLQDSSCSLLDPRRSPLLLSRLLLRAYLRDALGEAIVSLDDYPRPTLARNAALRSLDQQRRARIRYRPAQAPLLGQLLLSLMDRQVRPVASRMVTVALDGEGPQYELELEPWDEPIRVRAGAQGADPLTRRRDAARWEFFVVRELILARFGERGPLLVAGAAFGGPVGCDDERDEGYGAERVPQLAFADQPQPRPLQPYTLHDLATALGRLGRPVAARRRAGDGHTGAVG